MVNIYGVCFYGGLVLTILFFISSIVLFFVLKIPKVIGELTGRTAKKSMDEMKKNGISVSAVSKKEQAKYYNQGTGKITVRDTVSAEKRKENRDDTTNLLDSSMKTINPDEYDPNVTEVLGAKYVKQDVEATEILSSEHDGYEDDSTDVLTSSDGYEDDSTDVLTSSDGYEDDSTDVLTSEEPDEAATDVLTSEEPDEAATDVLTSEEADEAATDVLASEEADEAATDVLTSEKTDEDTTYAPRMDIDEAATDVLRINDDEDATSVLSSVSDATSVLSVAKSSTLLNTKAKVVYNVLLIHTDETL